MRDLTRKQFVHTSRYWSCKCDALWGQSSNWSFRKTLSRRNVRSASRSPKTGRARKARQGKEGNDVGKWPAKLPVQCSHVREVHALWRGHVSEELQYKPCSSTKTPVTSLTPNLTVFLVLSLAFGELSCLTPLKANRKQASTQWLMNSGGYWSQRLLWKMQKCVCVCKYSTYNVFMHLLVLVFVPTDTVSVQCPMQKLGPTNIVRLTCLTVESQVVVPCFGDLAWCIFAWMLVLILDDCLHASMKLHAMMRGGHKTIRNACHWVKYLLQ